MKNLYLSVFVFCFLPSCEVIHEGQGYGQRFGYADYNQQSQHQNRPWGKVDTYKVTENTPIVGDGLFRIVGDDGRDGTCEKVVKELGDWAQDEFNTTGSYPNLDRLNAYATKCFANHGKRLHATNTIGEPGGFKIVKFKGTQTVGQKVVVGEPTLHRSTEVYENQVSPEIRQRAAAGQFNTRPRQESDYTDYLKEPIPAPARYQQPTGGYQGHPNQVYP